MPGVVTSGRVLRKLTYVLHRVEVQKLLIVIICESTNVERDRSVDGTRGLKAGQFGGHGEAVDGGLVVSFLGAMIMWQVYVPILSKWH